MKTKQAHCLCLMNTIENTVNFKPKWKEGGNTGLLELILTGKGNRRSWSYRPFWLPLEWFQTPCWRPVQIGTFGKGLRPSMASQNQGKTGVKKYCFFEGLSAVEWSQTFPLSGRLEKWSRSAPEVASCHLDCCFQFQSNWGVECNCLLIIPSRNTAFWRTPKLVYCDLSDYNQSKRGMMNFLVVSHEPLGFYGTILDLHSLWPTKPSISCKGFDNTCCSQSQEASRKNRVLSESLVNPHMFFVSQG